MNDTFHRPETEEDPPELGFLSRLRINLAGADPDAVINRCPEDIGKLRAAGTIALGAFFYNSTVFSTVATHLAGHFSGELVAGGLGLAGYILATDSYIFFRCAHLVSGFEQLAQAGLEVSIPRKVRKMIQRSLGIRITQSCCLGLVVGVMTSLVVYSKDIDARIALNHLQGNSEVVRQLTEQTDSDLKRARDAINLTTGNIAALNKQINARLGRGVNAANTSQMQTLESRKTAEENRLAAQKAELSRLEAGRNDKLRSGLAGDPTVIQANMGVLAQINALEQIAGEDWKIALVILLIDFITVGFDLAPILAKMNWLPTSYSVLMAREYLERMQRVVDDMVPPEADGPDDLTAAVPANDNDPFGGGSAVNDNAPAPPMKRGRGRPRKYPPLVTNGSGQTPQS